jgi:hypothetical protein
MSRRDVELPLHRGVLCVTSGFRREVHENYVFIGYYAARSGSSLPKFQDNLSFPYSCPSIKKIVFLTLENGTVRLSLNVGKELLLLAA